MTSTRVVRALVPLVAHVGGKRRLAPMIVPWINAVAHRCYVEPFVGLGGLFFQRRSIPPIEVINDLDRDIATLFRVVRRHPEALAAELRSQVTSRAEFERLARIDPSILTDVERSARFLYLQACGFGGKRIGRTFGINTTHFHGIDAPALTALIGAFHRRLSRVIIECLAAADVVTRYDGPDTLFYLDPPYRGCEGDYGKGLFSAGDFDALARQLSSIAGRFVLSINDAPGIRDLFPGCLIEPIPVTYSINRRGPTSTTELIIAGPAERTWRKNGQATLWEN